MLVAELSNPRQFRLADAPHIPDPAPDQVQVAVKAVGICGSDLHYFSDGGIGEARCVYPMVLGHEPAGVVRKTGAGVSGWSAGDRAVLEPALYCYHCEYCMTGHHNVCANLRFLSQPDEPGFFREFVNLPAHNLLPLPAHLSDQAGALAEPLAVVVHSMQFAAPQPGETAVVFGAGPIGLLTIAVLKLSGVKRIWTVEPVAHRRDLARALGADAVIDPGAADPAREIFRDTANRGVDIAIDCAGKADSINQCIQAARHAGRVVVTGIPSDDYIRLALHILRRKELAFYSVRRSNHDSEAALRLLSAHSKVFAPILTHTRPLSDIQPAFELCEQYADGVGKLTITF
ncbi:MAG TPA: alcohol dehydrogenase catalytic domain-containing protein [Bryobacteraceae bacterium]|nr:alcohol dehydrogenase catalytic domain-containing protein [Bryobacteraceae bacterium]